MGLPGILGEVGDAAPGDTTVGDYANEVRSQETKQVLQETCKCSKGSFLPELTSCCSITPQPRTSSHSPWKLISISKEGWVKGK